MKPEKNSFQFLGMTRSSAKMIEYEVSETHKIHIPVNLDQLFLLTIGILGDLAFKLCTEERNIEEIDEYKRNLKFSCFYFDSYYQARLNPELDQYLILMTSASFYLCDLMGSSYVYIKKIDNETLINIDGANLEKLLFWLIKSDYSKYVKIENNTYKNEILDIIYWVKQFYDTGDKEENIDNLILKLRKKVYQVGTARQLLLADVIGAIVLEKKFNSSWISIPKYTGLNKDKWKNYITKKNSIKDFWPAQHLLGKNDIFKGQSAIIQMPTSSGKTKAIEIIIRNAILSNDINYIVIIAPFRALCNEIRRDLQSSFYDDDIRIDEISDVITDDTEICQSKKTILILTPEKFIYLLRQHENIKSLINLIIYDEGHQFDTGIRGVTYDFLLTTLKEMLPENIQQVLISAVMSNSHQISDWLLKQDKVVKSPTDITPTYRSLAFFSWDRGGQLKYVDFLNPQNDEFYVPNIIEQQILSKKSREKDYRYFPAKNINQGFDVISSISLYLGLKLIKNGAVAIFCGQKRTVIKLCNEILEAEKRGYKANYPINYSNKEEINKFLYLISQNIGIENNLYKCAEIGIFSHHGSILHGLRVSIEFAMKKELVKYIICTSTLAQGVNIPIKYLIIESVNQSKEKIKTRDLHNLLGRVGRAGIHTEGTVIFADPEIYDNRNENSEYERRKWNNSLKMLDPSKSEPCDSSLLDIFKPIYSKNEKNSFSINILKFYDYYNNDRNLQKLANYFVDKMSRKNIEYDLTSVLSNLLYFTKIFNAIENYIMANWEDEKETFVEDLIRNTLGYYLASQDQKEKLEQLVKDIKKNIHEKVNENNKKRVFGKTLLGLKSSLIINDWITNNIDLFRKIENSNDILNIISDFLFQNILDDFFYDHSNIKNKIDLLDLWINGKNYFEIFGFWKSKSIKAKWGKKSKEVTLENVIEFYDKELSFEGNLFIGAIVEQINFIDSSLYNKIKDEYLRFQKMIKYGLPDIQSVTIYEMGFSDRTLAQKLKQFINHESLTKEQYSTDFFNNKDEVVKIITLYPSYFQHILELTLRSLEK